MSRKYDDCIEERIRQEHETEIESYTVSPEKALSLKEIEIKTELRRLRIEAGFPTMSAAAKTFSIGYQAWQAWENLNGGKTSRMPPKHIFKMLRLYIVAMEYKKMAKAVV